MTFAGPEGRDIEYFSATQSIFKIENIRVWERNPAAVASLLAKFGPQLKVKQGEAFNLCTAFDERHLFPYNAINLDFTNGAFNLSKPRCVPHRFELLENVVRNQREHAASFLLLFATAATHDVDTDVGKLFVQKIAFDLATRLGETRALFNLTRDPIKTYPQTLATVIPPAIIRLGGENSYDVQCLGKALYRPYGATRTAMLCFAFDFTYDYPPLSETFHGSMTRMDEIIRRRQVDSFAVPILDVNSIIRKRTERRPRPKRRLIEA